MCIRDSLYVTNSYNIDMSKVNVSTDINIDDKSKKADVYKAYIGRDVYKRQVLMSAESIILPLFSTLVLTQLIGVYGIFITPTISGAVSIVVAIILWRKCIKSEIENS